MNLIKKTVYYLLGLVALLWIITLVLNLSAFDQEPLPEIKAIKDIRAQPINANNAYPALLAMNDTSGKPLNQVTKEVSKLLNQNIAESGMDFLTGEQYALLFGPDLDSDWTGKFERCNSRKDIHCIAKYIRAVDANMPLDGRLAEQLLRYTELLAFSDFREVTQVNIDSIFIPFAAIFPLKRVYLTQAYLTQNNEVFFQTVMEDMKFWRMILNNSHLMITRMLAVASLRDDVFMLSYALKHHEFTPAELQQIQRVIADLTPTEADLTTVFDFEFKFSLSMADYIAEEEPGHVFSQYYYFQPNATHNLMYQQVTSLMKELTKMDAPTIIQYQQDKVHESEVNSTVSWSPAMLYNPTGKLMVGNTPINGYLDYSGRIHDLSGMIRLLKLQIEVALSSAESTEQVVSQSQFTNPYTLKPMSYDASQNKVYFDCMDKTSVCALEL